MLRKYPLIFLSILFGALLLTTTEARGEVNAPLPAPTNISCQGWESTTVLIYWKDNATDEDNYRLERSVNGAAFSEYVTVNPDSNGNYSYKNTGTSASDSIRYRVRAYRASDTSYSPYSEICDNRRIYDPGKFRIFYGLLGTSDDCPDIDGQEVCLTNVSTGGVNNFVSLEYGALEGSAAAFARLGYTRPADEPGGGLDKIPINVVWCDGGGCAGSYSLGLSPLLMETPFNLTTRVGDPVAYIVAVHEAYHFQQFKYGGLVDPAGNWVIEGQARSIQDKICLGGNRATALCFDDIATGYAGYVPEINGYLSNPNRPVNTVSYQAALFWTYITEKYGTENMTDDAEMGLDILRRFWEESANTPGQNGISIINNVLGDLGYTERFRDVWKDFAVANYAKDYSGAAEYAYADMAQTGGAYGDVPLAISDNLTLGESLLDTDESVYEWGAKYYEVRPAADVPFIDIKIIQDSTGDLYYTVLGIEGSNITYEYNVEARNLSLSLLNDSYTRVAIIVAGLENQGNYRISINGTQPTLRILGPTSGNYARVGDPASPDKFMVQVEVVAGDGSPMAGVNLANFSFKVGTVDVPAANILTSAHIMGQQWFVLRAPAQSSSGFYNLTVKYGSALTDSETNAVSYTPRLNADNMIVIDRSGSMSWYGKMDAAKASSRLFIDAWRTGDSIGIVSFESSVTTNMALTPWTNTSRTTAMNTINALVADGGTRIGDAIRTAWDQLNASGNAANDWALILISDGEETDPGTETFDQAVNALVAATGKKPVIHSVAVGPDADRILMQEAAARTGGLYQYVSTPSTAMTILSPDVPADLATLPLRMDYRYRAIAANIAGQQQFYALAGPQDDGTPYDDTLNIAVENGAAELYLSLSWDTATGLLAADEVTLTDPNSNIVSPVNRDTRHIVWRVASPLGGNWVLYIPAFTGPDLKEGTQGGYISDYLVQATVKSDVTLDVFIATPPEERLTGTPIQVLASLTDIAPITGAVMFGLVENPSGGLSWLWFWDDGLHNDGAADDGLYGATFYQTSLDGSYNLTVYASGYSDYLDTSFVRQQVLSFHMDGGGDSDGDGLPDNWEIRYGLDPNNPDDADDDPDNDSLPNSTEWERGTDPQNSDTDGGGEGDWGDSNPFDPSDDLSIPTPDAHAYGGVGQVLVKHVTDPSYNYIIFFRGNDPLGPFTLLSIDYTGSGIYTDTAVTNGETYCYILTAVVYIDPDFHVSAATPPTCATPNIDPYPPHGSVLINGGAEKTNSRNVTLTLWATDAVDPEVIWPGDETLYPPSDSASGVTEMLISNLPDMSDATWEPYDTSKGWTLGQSTGLATVYVRYRDGYGNESPTVTATIRMEGSLIFLPMMLK
ncbi:MAG: VWA domain-containing protein [Anaerolineales bacterium]|nr:VWA domain-containing protein [Anaerolineales bacterium]